MKALEEKLDAAQVAFDSFVAAKSALGDVPRTEETPSCKNRNPLLVQEFKNSRGSIDYFQMFSLGFKLVQQTFHSNSES